MAVKLDRWEGAEERSRDEVFAELYESSYPSLVKYCRGLVGDEGDPEAIAQEAFLRAWMRWDRYSTSRPFWALVATIARNLCMDHHRHNRVVAGVLQHRAGELTSTAAATPDERVIEDEEFQWASEALSQLCPNHQRLLQLRDIEGMSCDEVAAAEGTSPEAATAALYRARQRLREAYNKVAAGAMAGVALFPMRGMRRRLGLWAHLTGNVAAGSPGVVARAGETVATVVAIAVVSGSPVVNPLPMTAPTDKPAPAAAQVAANAAPSTPAAATPAKPAAADRGAAASPGARAKQAGPGAALAGPAVLVAPDDVVFTQFVTPVSTRSRDVYANGTATKGCPSGTCSVLFHSPDGGTSWKQLKADGYTGGTLLLAPNFPVDNRMFAVTAGALQASTDGGTTFKAVAPLGGPAAMSPAFSSGEPQILLGALPGWVYDDDAETTTPLHLDPRPPGHTLSFSYSPGYPKDNRLLVGGMKAVADAGLQASTVSVCSAGKCAEPAVLPGADGTPNVLASRSFVGSGQAYAWTSSRLFRSLDGGGHFTAVTLPAKGDIKALSEGSDGALYLALVSTDAKGKTAGGVFVSRDGGKGWVPLGGDTPLAKGAASVGSIGTRLVASSAAGGMVCSADAGKTWAKSCPALP